MSEGIWVFAKHYDDKTVDNLYGLGIH